MPEDEWYEWPDWLILKKYSGVQRVKAEETNLLSGTVSQIAAMIHAYMAAQAEKGSKVQSLKPGDFLPFQISEEKKHFFDPETAKILLEAMKNGQVPVFATQIIVDCGLYDEIIQLGEQKR